MLTVGDHVCNGNEHTHRIEKTRQCHQYEGCIGKILQIAGKGQSLRIGPQTRSNGQVGHNQQCQHEEGANTHGPAEANSVDYVIN